MLGSGSGITIVPEERRVIAPTCEKSAGPAGPTVVILLNGREIHVKGSIVGWAIQPEMVVKGTYARSRTITPSLHLVAVVYTRIEMRNSHPKGQIAAGGKSYLIRITKESVGAPREIPPSPVEFTTKRP